MFWQKDKILWQIQATSPYESTHAAYLTQTM